MLGLRRNYVDFSQLFRLIFVVLADSTPVCDVLRVNVKVFRRSLRILLILYSWLNVTLWVALCLF